MSPCGRTRLSALFSALKMAPIWLQNRPQNGSKIDPVASWRAIGAVSAAWSALGGLLERCWSALGGLRGRKKDLLSGSWAFQEESQDRFQPSWRPKGSQTGAKKGAKTSPKATQAQKYDFFKNYCFFNIISMIFEMPRSFWRVRIRSKTRSESQHRRGSPQKAS